MYLLLALEIETRYVQMLAVTANPDGPWTTQQVRNLLMDLGERANGFCHLIRGYAERFVLTARTELPTAWSSSAKATSGTWRRTPGTTRMNAQLRAATAFWHPHRRPRAPLCLYRPFRLHLRAEITGPVQLLPSLARRTGRPRRTGGASCPIGSHSGVK